MEVKIFQHIEHISIYLVVIGSMIALATYTWQFRDIAGAKSQVYLQIFKISWLISLVMIDSSPVLADKLLWHKVYLLSEVFSPYFWFLFIMEISGQMQRRLPRVKSALLTIIGILTLLIVSSPWHGLMGISAWIDRQVLNMALGINSYLLCVAAIGFSVRWFFRAVGLRKRQALWFTLTGLTSMLGILLAENHRLGWLAPLPLGFFLTAFFVTWGFYRWRMYNLLPLAWKTAAQSMFDGLLVVDEYGYIADMNPAAKNILTGLPANIGGEYKQLASAWQVLGKVGECHQLLEDERAFPAGIRYYQLHASPLKIGSHLLGKVFVFKDITEYKENHAKILEQEKALSILTERRRLGRELHDGQGQLWGYINVQVEAARSWLERNNLEETKLALEKLAQLTQDTHVDIRESITGLQFTAAKETGIAKALEAYLAWFTTNCGIHTNLVVHPSFIAGMLSPTTEVQLLRIIQEALTNTRKHAGMCQVEITVTANGKWAEFRVKDNGFGFDLVTAKQKGRFGLKIMGERAAESGVEFHLQSSVGGGTLLLLKAPLLAEAFWEPDKKIERTSYL